MHAEIVPNRDLGAARGRRVVVFGGANVDLVGIADAKLVYRDSNPGHVRVSAGGVGRNIAENMARLGAHVELVTAIGSDAEGRLLETSCGRVGVGMTGIVRDGQLPTAKYVAITDENHDMALALNDMRVLDELTPRIIDGPLHRALVDAARLVVADANLRADTLMHIAAYAAAPLVLDAVSVAKAPRISGILDKVAALKCTAAEAAALIGEHEPVSMAQVEYAAEHLLHRGVRRVFISFGERGVHWAEGSESGWVAAPVTPIANTTGAGDAFAAGIAFAELAGAPSPLAAAVGTAMAGITLADESTVSEGIDYETVLERTGDVS